MGRFIIRRPGEKKWDLDIYTYKDPFFFMENDPYIYIWVILLKTCQNCDIEGKNSECEFFNAIIWK